MSETVTEDRIYGKDACKSMILEKTKMDLTSSNSRNQEETYLSQETIRIMVQHAVMIKHLRKNATLKNLHAKDREARKSKISFK